MIVDIGGGTTEVAVLSLGGIVFSVSVRVGGDKMDEAIVNYIRSMHNLLIGESTAERIKQNIGSASINKDSHSIKMTIKGRSLATGVPHEIEISQAQIAESLFEVVGAIADGVKSALENTAPELSSDIVDRGIVMTGGGSLLGGLAGVLHQSTGVPVVVSDKALHCVVLGTGKILEEARLFKDVLGSMY
jgi:rod shape-determining protein MreB